MTGGLIALAVAVAAATMLGFALRRSSGRFRAGQPKTAPTAAGAGATVLTEVDLGSRLGEQATLVQFSTTFCAPCRPTRQILAQVARMVEGVTHVEIDAASRLDLFRRLDVLAARAGLRRGEWVRAQARFLLLSAPLSMVWPGLIRRRPVGAEERAQLRRVELGLLERREVAAARGFGHAHDVRRALEPRPRRADDVAGEE